MWFAVFSLTSSFVSQFGAGREGAPSNKTRVGATESR